MAPRVIAIGRVDDVEDLLRRPGIYSTTSKHQAFGVLKALDWDPRVEITSEMFGPDEDTIIVRVDPKRGLRRNPEVMGFDPGYWTNKLDAYPYWETAWWRECIQNSRDAGATRIDLECREVDFQGTTAVMCVVRDDGRGMSEDVLKRAFLTFGGSVKEAGSVGGFGDAKELIIIPWLGYEIHSGNLIASGKHNTFEITTSPEPVRGTTIKVWMPREKATTTTYATGLLDRCNLPNITFTLNGRRVRADAGGGDLKLEAELRRNEARVGMLRIFHNPRSRRRGFFIRARGLFMFDRYVPESQYKGIVYVELEGNAKELFDQKRVSLHWGSGVAALIDRFIADLTVDKSALERKGKGKERRFYEGEHFEVMAGKAAETAAKMAMAAPVSEMKGWKDDRVSFASEQVDEIVKEMERAEEEDAREDERRAEPSTVISRTPTVTRVILEETKFVGRDHAANAMRLLAWKPTFLLVNEVDFYTVPAKARPEGMSPTYKTLLTLWAELCRFVLMRLGWTKPFGVGFIFSWDEDKGTTTLAAYTIEKDVDFLLVNPFKLKIAEKKRDYEGDIVGIKYDDEERWRVTDDETLKMLCSAAIHEATHMVNGLGQHNESFASALTENMGALIDMLPVAKKIRAAVTSRKARAERRGSSETKKRPSDDDLERALRREVTFVQPEPEARPHYYIVEEHGNILAEIVGKLGHVRPDGERHVEEWHAMSFVGGGGPTGMRSWPMDTLDQAKKWVLEKLASVWGAPTVEKRPTARLLMAAWHKGSHGSWELSGSTDPAAWPDDGETVAAIDVVPPDLFRPRLFVHGQDERFAPAHSFTAARELVRKLIRRDFDFVELGPPNRVPIPGDEYGDESMILMNDDSVGSIIFHGRDVSVWWGGKNYRETEESWPRLLFTLAEQQRQGARRTT